MNGRHRCERWQGGVLVCGPPLQIGKLSREDVCNASCIKHHGRRCGNLAYGNCSNNNCICFYICDPDIGHKYV